MEKNRGRQHVCAAAQIRGCLLYTSLQSKFLQLVQEKTYLPVGGVKWRQADVRIISATNLNLGRQVEEGLFREDLYYLSLIHI